MIILRKTRKFLECFFPLRLLLAHLKYNLITCIYWVILFGIVADKFATDYGVPYLFLSPEYNGAVSWLSFLFIGFAVGGFSIAYNIYSYMIMGKVFPFISTLSKPFYKFCINNAVLPVSFCIFYLIRASKFQLEEEMASGIDVFVFNLSFIAGFLLFVLLSFLYFFPTSKDVFKLSGDTYADLEEEPVSSFFHKQEDWTKIRKYKQKTYIYLQSFSSLKLSRPIQHYDKMLLEKVFSQNYINATLFEIATLIAFFGLGLFKEISFLQLPAGMSIIMLLTVILMLFSVFSSWFRKWTYPFLIILLVCLNFLSKNTALFRYNTYAYGLSYQVKKHKNYSWKTIQKTADNSLLNLKTIENAKLILSNWKQCTQVEKPKLIIVMTSGGGLRSSLWTFEVLNYLDSISGRKFNDHLHMITGASGGMIGAAYYRSLLLEESLKTNFKWDTQKFRENISSDLLNNLSLSASVNDLFLRLAKFEYKGKLYSKDRGYAFEHQLHKNTGNILEHPLSYFAPYEKTATIPLMIFSPTIVNDGRRLIISSQSLNFMSHATGEDRLTRSYENIDIHSFFKGNNAGQLRFSSVLRMSATFPYILPMTSLPTYPEVDVMDAGIRDNYGGKVTLEYLYELKDWIKENTSGVIIVQIRDKKKLLVDERLAQISLFDKLTVPATTMMRNFTKTQDYDIDEMMKFALGSFAFPTDIVTYNLKEAENMRISLSWHLTKNEKKTIREAIYSKDNQEEFSHFLNLFK